MATRASNLMVALALLGLADEKEDLRVHCLGGCNGAAGARWSQAFLPQPDSLGY